jgi:hypothetical protein
MAVVVGEVMGGASRTLLPKTTYTEEHNNNKMHRHGETVGQNFFSRSVSETTMTAYTKKPMKKSSKPRMDLP